MTTGVATNRGRPAGRLPEVASRTAGPPAVRGLTRLAGTPTAVIVAPVVVAAGVALLAWDYALLPPPPFNDILYWASLGLVFVGVWLAGTSGRPAPVRQILALAAFGAITWLPYFLRSPDHLLFNDERYHFDVLDRMLAGGSSAMQPRFYPLAGSFPGLEQNALTVMAWTGLAAEPAVRVLTLAMHAVIPVLAYLFARVLGLGRWTSFVAALVYAANTSYLFFHSIFSYESLGILLYLATWVVVARHLRPEADVGRPGEGRPRLLVAALPLAAGIVVTHHVSSYLLAISLAIAAVILRARRSEAARPVGALAVVTIAMAAGWFLVNVDRLGPYLVGTLAQRLTVLVDVILADHAQPRSLFRNSDLLLPERLIAFGYPALVLVLGIGGLVLVRRAVRNGRRRHGSPLWPVLAIVGPVGWLITTPAVLTQSGEVAYRSWPFLFLGVAPYAAIALDRLRRGWPRIALPAPVAAVGAQAAVPAVLAVLLMGGFSIGDNQAGRYPSVQPRTAAGPANATDDAVAAARWLRERVGDDHVVATDSGNAVTFSTDGGQQILRWNSWYPFLVDDPAQIVPFMVGTQTEFLVVDRQLTELPPRYGGYFGAPAIPEGRDPGQPIPAALFDRLDAVSGLERIYDDGRIQIYALAGAARGSR